MTIAEIKDRIKEIDIYATHELTLYNSTDGFKFEGKFTRVHGWFSMDYDAMLEQQEKVFKLNYASQICSCCEIPTDNVVPMLQELSNVKEIADKLRILAKNQITL